MTPEETLQNARQQFDSPPTLRRFNFLARSAIMLDQRGNVISRLPPLSQFNMRLPALQGLPRLTLGETLDSTIRPLQRGRDAQGRRFRRPPPASQEGSASAPLEQPAPIAWDRDGEWPAGGNAVV